MVASRRFLFSSQLSFLCFSTAFSRARSIFVRACCTFVSFSRVFDPITISKNTHTQMNKVPNPPFLFTSFLFHNLISLFLSLVTLLFYICNLLHEFNTLNFFILKKVQLTFIPIRGFNARSISFCLCLNSCFSASSHTLNKLVKFDRLGVGSVGIFSSLCK